MTRLTFRAMVGFLAAASLMALLCGCNKSTSGETPAAPTGAAAPTPTPVAVQSQINAQQQSEAAARSAHAPPGPK